MWNVALFSHWCIQKEREENCSNHFKHSRHWCILARLKCLKSIVWEPLLFSYTQNGMVTCLLISQIIWILPSPVRFHLWYNPIFAKIRPKKLWNFRRSSNAGCYIWELFGKSISWKSIIRADNFRHYKAALPAAGSNQILLKENTQQDKRWSQYNFRSRLSFLILKSLCWGFTHSNQNYYTIQIRVCTRCQGIQGKTRPLPPQANPLPCQVSPVKSPAIKIAAN